MADVGRAQQSVWSHCFLLLIATDTPAIAQQTYWLGEHTDFTGNGCPNNNDLNDVTSSLKSQMDSDGWSGSRFVNGSSWPRDYWETTVVPNGLDGSAGDAKGVAAYAGHGLVSGNQLFFGTPNLGACTVTLSTQTFLGTRAGDTAYGMLYLTSCTSNVSANPTANFTFAFNNETTQEFGFHNSPIIQGGSAGDFFGCSNANSNQSCWLSYMDDQYEFWFGWNSPVVVTHGPTSATCALQQAFCKWKAGTCTTTTWEPWAFWCYQWIDNGAGPCT